MLKSMGILAVDVMTLDKYLKNLMKKRITKYIAAITIGLATIVGVCKLSRNPKRITMNQELDCYPSWSPNGKIALFSRGGPWYHKELEYTRTGYPIDLYIISDNGKVKYKPHHDSICSFKLQRGSWSPDGKYLAVAQYMDVDTYKDSDGKILKTGIFAIPIKNGKLVTILSYCIEEGESMISDEYPAWSPNGSKVAFDSNRGGTDKKNILNNKNIWTISLNNKKLEQITNHPKEDIQPTWSPDSKKIAFASNRNGNYDIWIKELESGKLIQVTNHEADDIQPAWSPDGKYIAFCSMRDGNKELYLVKPNGKNLERITNHEADDEWPTWSPESKRIAFQSDRGNVIATYKIENGKVKNLKFDGKRSDTNIWIYDLRRILKNMDSSKIEASYNFTLTIT